MTTAPNGARLAAIRISVCAVLLVSPDLHTAARWADLPPPAMRPPADADWLVHCATWLHGHNVADVGAATWLYLAVVAALVLALVGLWTRPALLFALAGAGVLLGLPQLSGTVRHYHHLLWLLAVLAIAPCDRAWAVDVWRHRLRFANPPSVDDNTATRDAITAIWAVLAAVYFFPGLHKLLGLGGDAFASDWVLALAEWKWLQVGNVPALAAGLPPTLWRVGGAAVVLLELCWPLALLLPRLRPWFLLATFGFHQASARLLWIPFSSLWMLFPALAPWPRRWYPGQAPATDAAPAGHREQPAPHRRRALRERAAIAAYALLCLAIALPGAHGDSDRWPFACYPTFARRVGATMPAMRIEATSADGSVASVRPWTFADGDRQRRWGQQWSLIFERDGVRRCRAIDGYWASEVAPRRARSAPVTHLDVWRVWLDTDPATAGAERRAVRICAGAPGALAPMAGER